MNAQTIIENDNRISQDITTGAYLETGALPSRFGFVDNKSPDGIPMLCGVQVVAQAIYGVKSDYKVARDKLRALLGESYFDGFWRGFDSKKGWTYRPKVAPKDPDRYDTGFADGFAASRTFFLSDDMADIRTETLEAVV